MRQLLTRQRLVAVGAVLVGLLAGLVSAACLTDLDGSGGTAAGREIAFSARAEPGSLIGRQRPGAAGAKAALVRGIAAWGSLQAIGPGQAHDLYALAEPRSRAVLRRLARERFAAEPAYSKTARLPGYLIASTEDIRTTTALRAVMDHSALLAAEVAADDAAAVAHAYARPRRDAYPAAPMLAAGVSRVHLTRVSVDGRIAHLTATAENWIASAQREPHHGLIVAEPSGPLEVHTIEVYAHGTWTLRSFAEKPPAGWSP